MGPIRAGPIAPDWLEKGDPLESGGPTWGRQGRPLAPLARAGALRRARVVSSAGGYSLQPYTHCQTPR